MTETIGKTNYHLLIIFFTYSFCFISIKDLSQLPDNIKDYISKLQDDNARHINELQTQLTNLTAVVDFADSTKIAEIADLKQKHQQEVATLNLLMEGK